MGPWPTWEAVEVTEGELAGATGMGEFDLTDETTNEAEKREAKERFGLRSADLQVNLSDSTGVSYRLKELHWNAGEHTRKSGQSF